MHRPDQQAYDLAVIGAGMSGMAAALFAARRGLSVVLVGSTGHIRFASGYLDLLGAHPIEERRWCEDPWSAIEALRFDLPKHPLARIETPVIRAALGEYFLFLEEAGLPYARHDERNLETITPLGTTKRTYAVPQTMWTGVKALEERRPCLLVDFEGMKEYSAVQIAGMLGERWPGLRTVRIRFPGTGRMSRVYTRHVAQAMELEETRQQVADAVRPHLGDARVVGFPAVFGVQGTLVLTGSLPEAVGMPVFEIPTLPASMPGLRLTEAFGSMLPGMGVRPLLQRRVLAVRGAGGADFDLEVGADSVQETIRARGAVLATGRFLGKGLFADRERIREAVFDLPVRQPDTRSDWHSRDLLDPRGHPVNQAGVEVDSAFRPVDGGDRPVYPNLHACGSILAHQDWMRMKCGSGLAIATAYRAVEAFCASRQSKSGDRPPGAL